MNITSQDLVDKCRSFVGTKFVHQGRSKHGVDCAGLIVLSAKELGASVDDFTAYTMQPSAAVFFEYISKHADRVPDHEMQLGDLLIFEFDANPQHIAILSKVNPFYMIHAANMHRKVVEHRIDEKWMNKLRAVFRPRLNLQDKK